MKTPGLQFYVQAFFHECLASQRNCSQHTISSYRDSWRLFLRELSQRSGRRIDAIQLSDISAKNLLQFLDQIERVRRVSIGTRNCRLSAIKSFARFMIGKEPPLSHQFAEIVGIPIKRSYRAEVSYLEPEEVYAILAQPCRSTLEGERDYVLLSLLFNTGARIQEALSLKREDLRLVAPYQVRLVGKGRKERVCPIWKETAGLLESLIDRIGPNPNAVFLNRYGDPLGAAGVRFKLAAYVRAAAKSTPSLSKKKISPHTFRHSTGVALISAGVDVTVIRNLFGHASLDTTNHYARANLQAKRAALELVRAKVPGKENATWRSDPDLLTWLDEL